MMCSICGSVSVPSGRDGSGRSPAARSTVVVVVLGAVVVVPDDEPLPLEQALSATVAAPAPRPVRNVRRESTQAFYRGDRLPRVRVACAMRLLPSSRGAGAPLAPEERRRSLTSTHSPTGRRGA